MTGTRTAPAAGAHRAPRRPAGIAVFGCDRDEAALFRGLAAASKMELEIVAAPVSSTSAARASGFRSVSVDHRTPLTAPLLSALAAVGVEYVSARSIGTDHIDVDAARRLGLTVENVSYSPDGVADFTVLLILMLLRDVAPLVRRADVLDFRLGEQRGRELRDLTVGVVGVGRIGSAVVDRLRGFGCRVLTCDRASRAGIPLDELLERSDVVTLHAPLTPESHHLLDRKRIGRMRPGALLVNTARGALVETAALVDALEEGHLAGAALDVIEDEGSVFHADRGIPGSEAADHPVVSRLRRLPNVVVTGHTAYYTDHALRDVVENTLANCRGFEERSPSWTV